MAAHVSKFDAVRLARDAEVAGQAFGFVDVECHPRHVAAAGNWLLWAAGCSVLLGCLVYGLV
ncbi:MAG: hypothetical protein NTZ14_18325 [Hyphomicrobiales bacterium]|nr:hypothetical protein [Hyphomicrobiales bacterium]